MTHDNEPGNKRKKPTRLEWQGSVLASSPAAGSEAVEIKGKASAETKGGARADASAAPSALSGTVRVRREVKGRAGKPVTLIFGFSDARAHDPVNLKALLSRLKNALACGGGLEEGPAIVVQVDDVGRVAAALSSLGLSARPSGG